MSLMQNSRSFVPDRASIAAPRYLIKGDANKMRIPVHREHSFRFKVNADSADAEPLTRSDTWPTTPTRRTSCFKSSVAGTSTIVVTTNLLFKQWDTVFPNASCAVALIDRLTHHAEIIPIEGESYRKREAELTQKKRRGSA